MKELKKVSVVLCTYNSAAFLPAFLDSLAKQTVKPDELIVSDDASSDSTLDILSNYAKNQTFPVNILRNSERLGYAQNFSRAFQHATGKFIFPADHDDFWLPNKIERLVKEMEKQPHLEVMFSNSFLSGDGAEIKGDYWSRIGLTPKQREGIRETGGFDLFLKRGVVPGHAMAIRGGFLHQGLPVALGWPHDHWLSVLAAAQKAIAPLEESLVKYRIHPRQELGVASANPLAQMFARIRLSSTRALAQNRLEAEKMAGLAAKLRELGVSKEYIDKVSDRQGHFARRAGLNPFLLFRAGGIAIEYLRGGYSKYENGISSALKDLFSRPN